MVEEMWPPPADALAGTLEELAGMDCVIELDEGEDGDVDQSWGIDYLDGKITRKLLWSGGGSSNVKVVSMDENEQPWLVCWPGGCDRITNEPWWEIDATCAEGSISIDGIADSTNVYFYSEGCLARESPQLGFLPYTKNATSDFPTCAFWPFPFDAWTR